MIIQRLPQNLINQIAAGEVVERPASVVKELVENALDAGAQTINLHLRHGGKSFICVTDDGQGMGKDDLELCLERHATSKLPDKALDNINFLGFRGEALPALGSISRLQITSKEKEAVDGWSIGVAGGEKEELKPAACAQGTTVELRDLFYATPARLKFLKGDSTEYKHCNDVFVRLAMAYPHVTFILKHNGRETARWQGAVGTIQEQMQKRISAILGQEFIDNSLYHEVQKGSYKIRLLAGLPTMNRSQATYQYIFINNRAVRDKISSSAIRQAYQDYLSRDRHPMVVVYIEMPSEEVDVNVHPAKAEVRFRQAQIVRQLIGRTLFEALQKGSHQSSTTIATDMCQKFENPTTLAFSVAKNQNIQDSQMQKTYGSPNERPSSYSSLKSSPGLFSSAETHSVRHIDQAPMDLVSTISKNESDFPPLGWAVAQVYQTYIVAQAKDGLILVDQHAAHERITYERFKKQLGTSGVTSQALLSPEVVELSESQVQAVQDNKIFLEELGLKFESFGEKGILVQELPSLLGSNVLIKKLIQDVSDDLLQAEEPLALQDKIFHLLATQACHGSVRSGRKLAVQEMNALLRQIEETPFSGQCNHGRPTYVKLKLKDLEHLFGRE